MVKILTYSSGCISQDDNHPNGAKGLMTYVALTLFSFTFSDDEKACSIDAPSDANWTPGLTVESPLIQSEII